MTMDALPPLKAVAPELYPPLLSVTDPVDLPPLAVTEIATVNGCTVVMLGEDGVTVNTGVIGGFPEDANTSTSLIHSCKPPKSVVSSKLTRT